MRVFRSLYHMNSLERGKENAGPSNREARTRAMGGSSPAGKTQIVNPEEVLRYNLSVLQTL